MARKIVQGKVLFSLHVANPRSITSNVYDCLNTTKTDLKYRASKIPTKTLRDLPL